MKGKVYRNRNRNRNKEMSIREVRHQRVSGWATGTAAAVNAALHEGGIRGRGRYLSDGEGGGPQRRQGGPHGRGQGGVHIGSR